MTLTSDDDEQHFNKLKQLLKTHHDKYSVKEARDMYTYAQNYCIKKINSGFGKYLHELFQLYKITLENKIVFAGKYLSHWAYKNIVGVGLRLGEFDWVEQFINDYKDQLNPERVAPS
jgi:hypothetical protein